MYIYIYIYIYICLSPLTLFSHSPPPPLQKITEEYLQAAAKRREEFRELIAQAEALGIVIQEQGELRASSHKAHQLTLTALALESAMTSMKPFHPLWQTMRRVAAGDALLTAVVNSVSFRKRRERGGGVGYGGGGGDGRVWWWWWCSGGGGGGGGGYCAT